MLANALRISLEECLAIPRDPRLRYRPFTIKKKTGGRRKILAPTTPLKNMQRLLLDEFLSHLDLHPAAMAFRKGYSVASHAQVHANQQIILTVDLRDFFSSTSTARVRKLFHSLSWRGESLRILTRLTTFEDGLPQGAPTSPAISNLVNYTLDAKLQELAAMSGGLYSRYCDDLAFSWNADSVAESFVSSVTGVLDSYGYEIQSEKGWRLQRCADGANLPGVVIQGNRLRPTDHFQKKLNSLKRRWFKSDTESRRLAGYLGYARMLRSRKRR